MPKPWSESVKAHQHEVRNAILDTTAALVTRGGLLSLTMSQIAEQTGIGRATLYKYFPDLQAIQVAWHERQVHQHLTHLTQVGHHATSADERLQAVLEAYALMSHQRHDAELSALLHQGQHVAHAEHQLHDFIRGLIAQGAADHHFRQDIPADELARYCLHALTAAGRLPSREAVHRLVQVTLTGLRPPVLGG